MKVGRTLSTVPPSAADQWSDGQRLALEVTGMTCASCVRRVERALAAVPGVAAATVNLAAESADVTLADLYKPEC
jgi:cation transport ATPase